MYTYIYICNEADVNHVDGAAQDDMLIARMRYFGPVMSLMKFK